MFESYEILKDARSECDEALQDFYQEKITEVQYCRRLTDIQVRVSSILEDYKPTMFDKSKDRLQQDFNNMIVDYMGRQLDDRKSILRIRDLIRL